MFIAIIHSDNLTFFRAAFTLNAMVLAGILVAPNDVMRFEAETRTEAISQSSAPLGESQRLPVAVTYAPAN